ncbi:MAG: hypothetical protein KGR98_09085 [Verrucomicrobia bacterium]|nr:hypothetical protein [Verrucomicrobiota bacterium]MDE3100267.1 hypothetical protein [Verrucomicrobiota bacterium]
MEATLTQLQRQAGRLAQAIARRESVRLTRHGRPIAEIEPAHRGMSGADFARAWRNRKRMDRETCDEMVKALDGLDRAG